MASIMNKYHELRHEGVLGIQLVSPVTFLHQMTDSNIDWSCCLRPRGVRGGVDPKMTERSATKSSSSRVSSSSQTWDES